MARRILKSHPHDRQGAKGSCIAVYRGQWYALVDDLWAAVRYTKFGCAGLSEIGAFLDAACVRKRL